LGYQVPALETTGHAAVKKAEELQPDLILMDIKLPGNMDGIEAADKIRSNLDIPVVYLTAYADEEILARAKITEPFGYILKPFGIKELHSNIEIALYKYRTDKKRAQTETALQYSEHRYKQLLESVTDYIYTVEIEQGKTTNIYHAPGCEAVTGYTPEEFQANAYLWYQMIHQEDREHAIAQTEKLIAGKTVPAYEHRIIHKDGITRWVRNTPVPRYNTEGVLIGYDGLIADITARKQAEEALRQAEIEYRTVANFTYDWEIWENPDGTLRYVSPSCQRLTGYTAPEFLNNPALMSQLILPEDRETWDEYRRDMIKKPERREIEFRIQQKDGKICWIEHAGVPVTGEQGTFLGYRASNRDISRRKRAEAEQEKLQGQLLQAQKMEAIGRLTGGIAHDFNNLLTAINGFAELAQQKLPADHPVQDLLKYVLDAGHRAANLVRQLLAFSRKQIIEPKIIDPDNLIPDLDKMLRRIIGEDINLETDVTPNTWPIKIDPAQIEQLIINLAVNARDAMPDGGKITITAENTTLTGDDLVGHPETRPGEYVLLSIKDTGSGMSNDILANIFEPFFTTKEQGKGTGLGLATVYGIVKQNRGDIWVKSLEGQGTTFKIYLPRAEGTSTSVSKVIPLPAAPRGNETILLTEDDPEVRELARRMLERQGYNVLDTATGTEALHLAKHYAHPIDLLLTDVIMPDINGKILAEQILRLRPDLKVMFISGYPDEAIAKHGIIETGIVFLQKPFTAGQLTQLVRATLDLSRPAQQMSPGIEDEFNV